jgi:hypothetical protein
MHLGNTLPPSSTVLKTDAVRSSKTLANKENGKTLRQNKEFSLTASQVEVSC